MAQWDEEVELALAWTEEEQAAYTCADFGTEARRFDQAGKAPTALHSWGCALRACPCGCRSQGFCRDRLRRQGLRGVGVFSTVIGKVCGASLGPTPWLLCSITSSTCCIKEKTRGRSLPCSKVAHLSCNKMVSCSTSRPLGQSRSISCWQPRVISKVLVG